MEIKKQQLEPDMEQLTGCKLEKEYNKAYLTHMQHVLSHFSHVRLFVTPWTIACQASLSMGFSRQEYWSGLPWLPPGDLLNSGIKPRSPTLQADSSLAEPPGKLKNTGVGSLSVLQGIFLIQESNWGLLHCRWILYQLSTRGSSRVYHLHI